MSETTLVRDVRPVASDYSAVSDQPKPGSLLQRAQFGNIWQSFDERASMAA